MAGRLTGKVALVTGGSSGIGRATAQIFAREGAKVVVADVGVEGGEETVRLIQAAGGEAVFMKTDVSKSADVEAMVNTASVAGLVGLPGFSAYVAAKHGVNGLTKTAALEYAKSGIRVNAVCPGAIRTPMFERGMRDNPGIEEQIVAAEPIGRMAAPAEVGE